MPVDEMVDGTGSTCAESKLHILTNPVAVTISCTHIYCHMFKKLVFALSVSFALPARTKTISISD
jgi:hypothetical protein